MSWWDSIRESACGGVKETHDDGSTTERFAVSGSITRDAKGNVTGSVHYKTVMGTTYAVSCDSEGNETGWQETNYGK